MASTKADFSQNNPAWAGKLLGFSSWETIGRWGCLVDAFANVAQAQGDDVNPAQMNDRLKNRGQFVRDSFGEVADVAGYPALGVVAPHSKFMEQRNWASNVVAPYSYFDVRSNTSVEVICMIDYHPEAPGIQSHYVRVIGTNAAQNDIEIVDSWDGKRKWLSEISNRVGKKPNQLIWTAARYQKV